MSLSNSLGKFLSLLIGSGLILTSVFIFWSRGHSLQKIAFASTLAHSMRKFSIRHQALVLGSLTVFLPCMTLTPALGFALASHSTTQGALLMLSFFLGTLPAMVISPMVPKVLVGLRYSNVTAALFLLISGIITVARMFHA